MAGTGELCLGGGAMLNCSSNGALQKASLAANIWVFPGASDCGLSVGAAALCAAELGELERARLSQAYLGPEFTESECEQELRREKNIAWRRVGNIENEVAEYLAGGETVGWFQGRMEFGPRALGNRSILADPRDPEMHKRVNRIKGREYWRPLGPVVNAERSSEYFELSGPSPFMLFRVNVVPSMRSTIPAVVHVDGSARPQTVTKDQNPRLRKLLTAFDHLTSVPVLLNTSFNAAGEPIVCTPRDAIKAFLAMRLDCLAIGDFVVTRASDA
jgi:carbamoyltransferase